MSPEIIGIIGIAVMTLMIFLRFWIGIVFVIVGFIGYGLIAGWHPSSLMVGMEPFSNVANYTWTVLPMFVLMGAMIAKTGISKDIFDAAHKWLGQLRGGLAIASIGACALFAAICGSSLVTALTIGRIAIPEMRRHQYDDKLALGSIVAGGSMGILIPPSLGFILYGLLTENSIGKLFMAGIIPGILQAVLYMVVIYVICKIKPMKGPAGPKIQLKEKLVSLKGTWSILVLFVLVLGGIYLGVFTPTEAGAIGAFGAIVVALVTRRFTRAAFGDALVETVQTAGLMALILTGAFILMRFISVSNISSYLSNYLLGVEVPKTLLIVFIVIFYVLIGSMMDVIAAILITIPIVYPLMLSLGFDPIWFGVLLVRMMEIGEFSPPFGLNSFVLASVTGAPVSTVFRGVVPFIIADVCHITLLIAFPVIALFLPNTM